jgi:ATP-binding cassette, subfamily C, bacterial
VIRLAQNQDPQRRAGSVLQLFFGTSVRSRLLVVAWLLLAGVAEGIGIASVLQLLSLAGGSGPSSHSPLHEAILKVLHAVGLDPTLLTLLGIVILGVWLRAALLLIAMNTIGVMVAKFATGLRLSLIDALLQASWGYFAHHPIGRYANAISVEASRAAEAYLAIATCITLAVQAVVYVIIALTISWRLSLLSLVMGVVVLLAFGGLVHMSRRAGRRQTERTQALVSRLSDVLAGIKPLKAMGQQDQLGDFFRVRALRLNAALRRQVLSRQTSQNLKEPVLVTLLGLAFYVAIGRPDASLPDLLVMAFVLIRTVTVIGKAQDRYQEAVAAESAYWSLRELIDDAGRQRETRAGTLLPTLEHACVLRDVSFSHDDRPILERVSLRVETGQITLLTGVSGAGKTTIVDLLAGLLHPGGGSITIDDVALSEIDLRAWRQMIGYVSQDVMLFNDTILANVTLERPGFTREAAIDALKEAGAWEFVSRLPDGMDTHVGERGSLLSGGERQRIALARALSGQPRLLILDEATSALDIDGEAALCKSVAELCQRQAIAALVIAHRPAWVRVADRVYVLAAGRVQERRPTIRQGAD